MRKAVIYPRISDDREGREYGVQRQVRDCRRKAEKLGWEVVAVLPENDTSAYAGKPRPMYEEMLRMLRSGEADAVIALTSRRLQRRYREAFDFLDLVEERGIAVATVKGGSYDLTTADGRREARRKAIDDQHESEEISERVRDAKADAAARGEFGGGRRPFGFERDGVTVRESEAVALRWSAQRVLAGVSLSATARKLAADGVTTSSGKPVTAGTLRRCLINPRYAGLRVYRPAGSPRKPQAHYDDSDIAGPAVWPAVLDEITWRGVRAILMDPTRRNHDRHGTRVWLGTGEYLCSVCQSRVRSSAQTSRTRDGRMTSYTCPNGSHVSRRADLTDAFVREAVAEYLRALPPPDVDEVDLAAGFKAEIAGLRARLDELARQFAAGSIDAQQLAAGSGSLRSDLEAVQKRQTEVSRQALVAAVTGREDAASAFLDGDLDYQRLVLSSVATVTLLPAPKGRPKGWRPGEPYFDPDTIDIDFS